MTEEGIKLTEKEILQKYPKIFCEYDKPMTQTCMCWGLDCGPGWYELIDKLCSRLDFIAKTFNVNIVAKQVKQKFGTLRFYWSVNNDIDEEVIPAVYIPVDEKVYDLIDAVVDEACWRSASTCESCGGWGKCNESGWITCLCDECRKENKRPPEKLPPITETQI